VISVLQVLPIAAFFVDEVPRVEVNESLRLGLPLSREVGVVGGLGLIDRSIDMSPSSHEAVEDRVEGVTVTSFDGFRSGVPKIILYTKWMFANLGE